MLAHPLLVEAIEDNFVPVAVYNNVGGTDKAILQRFNEPAWNYQVMRFTNADGKDIVPRRDKVWTVASTANRISEALVAAKKPVPSYLKNVVIPEATSSRETIVLSMYCFWTGEAVLGALDGVLTTEAGFYDRHEVVKVTYDPKKIGLKKIITTAEKMKCADGVYLEEPEHRKAAARIARNSVKLFKRRLYRAAPASDQKKQLQRDKRWQSLQVTPLQLTKLNAAVGSGRKEDVNKWLTPRQQKQLLSKK